MRTWLLTVSLLLAAPAARAADPVVLLPATGANVGEGELTAATDMLRADLEATGRFRVVAIGRTPGGNVQEPAAAEAAGEARAAGAQLAITLRVSRLGQASTARLAAHRPDGSLFHSDQMSAATPEDLEAVLQRLAQGLASARPGAEVAELGTVTESEARAPRRMEANQVRGLRLDVAWLGDGATNRLARLTGGGVFWLYDARSFLADVSVDYQLGGGSHLLDAALGVYLPLSRRNVAPYLGAGLGYAVAHRWDETAAGLEAKGAGGVLVGRLSNVQIRAEVGYRFALFHLRVEGEKRTPQGPFLNVGLGF